MFAATAAAKPVHDVQRVYGRGLIRVNGHGAEWHRWQRVKAERRAERLERQLVHARAQVRRLSRELHQDPQVVEAINLACATYPDVSCDTLFRKARCETGGTFSARAHNPSGATGLFQFLPSTFASTPFARLDIWSPYVNAMAAAWMHHVGRGGEWSCR